MEVDYLVVGSGLTGATIARLLRDKEQNVAVIERRPLCGGNICDYFHESGIRVHIYGPHYFRTSSDRIWHYVNRFGRFYQFEAVVMSEIDGRLEHWPILSSNIDRLVGANWTPSHSGPAANFEEKSLAMMPELIYRKFVHGYTAKQWGAEPRSLEPSLAGRFEVRTNMDLRLKTSKYQGIPIGGYTRFMQSMLQGLQVYTNVDYLKNRGEFFAKKMIIFTGPIDEYFNFDLGRLDYRSQRRIHRYLPNIRWRQPVPQINYPDPNVSVIRTLEWKHMMEPELRDQISGTVVTSEIPYTPQNPHEYEYPLPDATNRFLLSRYRARIDESEKLLICGRLGEYRYFDMDQAIARAMMIADRLVQGMGKRDILVTEEGTL